MIDIYAEIYYAYYITIHITYVYNSKRFQLTNHNLTFGSGSGGHIPGRSKKVAQVEESEEERSEGRPPTEATMKWWGFFNRGKRGKTLGKMAPFQMFDVYTFFRMNLSALLAKYEAL